MLEGEVAQLGGARQIGGPAGADASLRRASISTGAREANDTGTSPMARASISLMRAVAWMPNRFSTVNNSAMNGAQNQ